jgi:site-specific recombinase XerC
MARPEYIDKKKRDRLFSNTLASPNNGVRDHALLRLLFGSFIKPIELIRINTNFFVNGKGIVLPNENLLMPSEISFNGKDRPMPILNPILIDALQKWVNFRIENTWGITSTGYIDLSTPMFMSKRNIGFSISTSRQGEVTKHNSDSLNRHIRKRMKMNGITGSIDSASRTLTLELHRSGKSTKAIWRLRGDAQLDTTMSIIQKDPVRLAALVENVY